MKKGSPHSRRNFLKGAAVVGGAASLGACVSNPTEPVITQAQVPTFYPKHNDRTKGWLRFMWQKATTPGESHLSLKRLMTIILSTDGPRRIDRQSPHVPSTKAMQFLIVLISAPSRFPESACNS